LLQGGKHFIQKGLGRKGIVVGILVLFIGLSITLNISGDEKGIIYVDDDGGADYTSIQDAIDNSQDGDTIYVFSGIYYENVDIYRRDLNLLGEDTDTTIIDAGGSGHGIKIRDNHDNSVSGFTIRNALGFGLYLIGRDNSVISYCKIYNSSEEGVRIDGDADNNIIDNCEIFENGESGVIFYSGTSEYNQIRNTKIYSNSHYGIGCEYDSNDKNYITISNCEIFNNSHGGIAFNHGGVHYNQVLNTICFDNGGTGIWTQGHDNKFINNTCYNNIGDGIYTQSYGTEISKCLIYNNTGTGIYVKSHSQIIENNEVYYCGGYGCWVKGTSNIDISNSIFNNNKNGLNVDSSHDDSVVNCSAYGNMWSGFLVDSSYNIDIINCSGNDNYNGIHIIDDSYNNLVKGCRVEDNSNYGIYTISSDDNLIYNNYFDNINNAFEFLSIDGNIWNISKTNGTNIVGGPNLGGNYWSDYTGIDADEDGIGDTPYNIPEYGSQDNLPLFKEDDTLPKTQMGIIPSNPTPIIGEEFNITIYIDPTETVGGWEIFQLDFTQGQVNADEVTPGFYWEEIFDPGDIDNDTGMITEIQSWTTGPYPDSNHTACIINFTALEHGQCTFELISVQVDNSSSEIMDVITYDASIVITVAPIIYGEYPVTDSTDVMRPPSELCATVEDPDGDLMDICIRWKNHDGEWVTVETYDDVGNGTYNFIPPIENDWIWGNTTYVWSVNATDGTLRTNNMYQYTTSGSRYDVSNDDLVNFHDAGLVWVHRTSGVDYDGIYDVNQDGQINFGDAGLTWINRD
jgi:parallel beta-helix repeat protein